MLTAAIRSLQRNSPHNLTSLGRKEDMQESIEMAFSSVAESIQIVDEYVA